MQTEGWDKKKRSRLQTELNYSSSLPNFTFSTLLIIFILWHQSVSFTWQRKITAAAWAYLPHRAKGNKYNYLISYRIWENENVCLCFWTKMHKDLWRKSLWTQKLPGCYSVMLLHKNTHYLHKWKLLCTQNSKKYFEEKNIFSKKQTNCYSYTYTHTHTQWCEIFLPPCF